MKIGIIIPVHNEETFLEETLLSLINQEVLPHQIILVDDNSTDGTAAIIQKYTEKYAFIQSVYRDSSAERIPGAKIVQAFYSGIPLLSEVTILCKFDADLVFPKNYLREMVKAFSENPKLGMYGGFCSIENNGSWEVENLTNKNHLRGALKSYRKECFEDIGGLRESMGWDTIDELLARYKGWEIETNEQLLVKHRRVTASGYKKQSGYMQGTAFYKMRYGFLLMLIASLKLASKKKKIGVFWDYCFGYVTAFWHKVPFLVSPEEGKWIRKYRWKGIFQKISIFQKHR